MDLKSALERRIPDSEIPDPQLNIVKRNGSRLRRRRRATGVAASLLLISGMLTGVVLLNEGDRPPRQPQEARQGFFASLADQGDYEPFESLEEFVSISDVVVIGTFEDVSQGRSSAARGAFDSVLITVALSEIVRGDLPASDRETLVLELPKPRLTPLAELRESLPDAPVLLILQDIARYPSQKPVNDDAGNDSSKTTYLLPTPKGLFIEREGRVFTPLDDSPAQFDSRIEAKDLDELADAIRALP